MKYMVVNQRHADAGDFLTHMNRQQPSWNVIYSQTNDSKKRYFNSFKFVSNWLSQWPRNIPVCSSLFFKEGVCVGIVFFTESKERVGKLLPVKTVHILRSGQDNVDQIWPEYVEPVLTVDKAEQDEAWAFWLNDIIKFTGAHQIYQHVSPKAHLISTAANTADLDCYIENEEPGAVCNLLSEVKLKSSIRRKVSQTERKLGIDASHLKEASSESDLNAIYDSIASWHQRKWQETETPSGFGNPVFYNSLRAQLQSSFESVNGVPRARCFYVEKYGELLGATVLLEDGEWTGFYLSAYKPYEHNHVHLGTWMHVMLIQKMKEQGQAEYDFMAGDERYKEHFADWYNTHARGRWIVKGSMLSLIMTTKKMLNRV